MKRHRWTRPRIWRALRWLAERIGRTPGALDLRRAKRQGYDVPSEHTCQRHCGSMRNAQREAGLVPNCVGGQRRKRYCKRGHRRTAQTVYPNGSCRLCLTLTQRERRATPEGRAIVRAYLNRPTTKAQRRGYARAYYRRTKLAVLLRRAA